MSPKLMRGAVVGIDRHYNSLTPLRTNEPNVYVVRLGHEFYVRYVEEVGGNLMLRAERASERLVSLSDKKGDPMAAIIGRVCWMWLGV